MLTIWLLTYWSLYIYILKCLIFHQQAYIYWCLLSLLSAGAEAESVLVDPPEARWQTVEPEQLPHRHDPSSGRRGGHPGTHTLQRHLLSHLGGSLLVRARWHFEKLFDHFRAQATEEKVLLSFSCAPKSVTKLSQFLDVIGKRPVALRSPWNGRSWPMPRGLVWTKSPTVASHFGGHPPSTEPTSVQPASLNVSLPRSVDFIFLKCLLAYFFLSSGVRGFPGAAWPDRNLYARQDPHSEDLPHSDLQGSLVAEDSREHCHGSLSSRFCVLPHYGLSFYSA